MQVAVQVQDAPVLPTPTAPDLRRELLNLAEPVIADLIHEAYGDLTEDEDLLRLWSAQHRRLWRAILLDHRDLMRTLATELRDGLAEAGLAPGLADTVDQGVLEELVDITVKCFRYSTDKTRRCSMILLDAASFVGAARTHA